MKFSRDLLELRDKESKLVKSKRYEEAEKIKMKADLLEEFERNKLEAEVSTCSILILLIDASCFAKEGGQTQAQLAAGTRCIVKAHLKRQKRAVEAQVVGQPAIDLKKQEYLK